MPEAHDAKHGKSDQGRDDMPADQGTRLGRLRFRRTDHQHDGGRKRDEDERILNCERRPLHGADRESDTKARASHLCHIEMNDTAPRPAHDLLPIQIH
jgi:hypothetical protein